MNRNNLLVISWLAAFVLANLLVKWIGATGLWFSSFFLIPFDFVCRCYFHETWKGVHLLIRLLILTLVAGIITFAINQDALNVALASFCGFTFAQVGAGIFYQKNKEKSFLFKVNISDSIGIIFDSFVFQLVAFNQIDIYITSGQIVIKVLGGLLWYLILFRKRK